MKAIFAIATIVAAMPAQAATYVYQCCHSGVYQCHGTAVTGIVKVDEDKAALTWRGTTFQNLKVVEGGKYSWQAIHDGVTAELSTATKGIADLTIGKAEFSCQQMGRPAL